MCRTAYKQLATKFHSDKIGENPYFAMINKAHEVLCNEEKKEAYDEWLKNSQPYKDIKKTNIFREIAENKAVQKAIKALTKTGEIHRDDIGNFFKTFEKEISSEVFSSMGGFGSVVKAGKDIVKAGKAVKNVFKFKKNKNKKD